MKSAYELAMERLEKDAPTKKLTEQQKDQIQEIQSLYQSKIAERETFLKGKIVAAQAKGDYAEVEELDRQLSRDISVLRDELEAKKQKVWAC